MGGAAAGREPRPNTSVSMPRMAIPAGASYARHHGQHEPHRLLLGQRLREELLPDLESRVCVPLALRDSIRLLAIDLQMNLTPGRLLRNLVSTKAGEDQSVVT